MNTSGGINKTPPQLPASSVRGGPVVGMFEMSRQYISDTPISLQPAFRSKVKMRSKVDSTVPGILSRGVCRIGS